MAAWATEPIAPPASRRIRRARLRVISGPDRGMEHELSGRAARIGQSPANELSLTDPTVSGQHLEVVPVEQGYRLQDLDSRNGTLVSGVRIGVAFVETSVMIDVGQTTLELNIEAESTEIPVGRLDRFGVLVGRSIAMREVWQELERFAASDATLLITGETGTGKEAIASAVVSHSPRADGPWVVVDCGALAPTLVESELYGHEKGAFTGADRAKAGAFERAHGGTVFLDEVGELPLELQPKLLRVLESREVQRVGGTEPRKVDFRLIAATHRGLEQRVNRGSFRADLYYRLSILRVHLPPLRERPEDIAQLAAHFLMELGASPELLDDAIVERLIRHDWPGNVRELRNAVERLVVGTEPIASGLSPTRVSGSSADAPIDLDTPFRIQKDRLVGDFERRYAEALKRYSPTNLSKAARKAGLNRMGVVKLFTRHGLIDDEST